MPRWTVAKSGEVFDFRVLKVRQDQMRDPRQGDVHPRLFIEAPDWVTVLACTDDGDAVLVRQFRFGVMDDTLELPGGMVDEGETALAAARRELEEETGFRPRTMRRLGVVHPNPAIQNNRCHLFLAKGCRRVHEGRPDHGEHLRVERYPLSALPRLVADGQITHSLSITALYFQQATVSARAKPRPAPPRRRPAEPRR